MDFRKSIKISTVKNPSTLQPSGMLDAESSERKKLSRRMGQIRDSVHKEESECLIPVNISSEAKKDHLPLLNAAFDKQNFLKTLDAEKRNELINNMSYNLVEKGNVMIRQGTNGQYFHCIQDGVVEILVNNEVVNKLTSGSYFGEIALLHDSLRNATVKTVVDSHFYSLDRKTFRETIARMNNSRYLISKSIIESFGFLSLLDDSLKSVLINNLIKEQFAKDKYIIKSNYSFIKVVKKKCVFTWFMKEK